MSDVWLTIPSKKPAAEANAILQRWRDRGYKLAIFRDAGDMPIRADLLLTGTYPGYAKAVNALCAAVMATTDVQWMVTGGDDCLPDPELSSGWIAALCAGHFGGSTLGVMQPTGDSWGDRASEKNAVCPWMGREFCKRVNQGRGPLWPDYFHYGVDSELQRVAEKLGIFWQCPDVTQVHEHWSRYSNDRPSYLMGAAARWHEAMDLLARRTAEGFPGSELLPI